ncbi:MAG: hypothetical protein JXX14_10880, partial [Deltaproteobacteria bacterium]|nr:hypothetical protein [Deltaproteobacteria bacterium]
MKIQALFLTVMTFMFMCELAQSQTEDTDSNSDSQIIIKVVLNDLVDLENMQTVNAICPTLANNLSQPHRLVFKPKSPPLRAFRHSQLDWESRLQAT